MSNISLFNRNCFWEPPESMGIHGLEVGEENNGILLDVDNEVRLSLILCDQNFATSVMRTIEGHGVYRSPECWCEKNLHCITAVYLMRISSFRRPHVMILDSCDRVQRIHLFCKKCTTKRLGPRCSNISRTVHVEKSALVNTMDKTCLNAIGVFRIINLREREYAPADLQPIAEKDASF